MSDVPHPDPARLAAARRTAVDHLLDARNDAGHWEGELSSSALSTAVAVMALGQVDRGSEPGGAAGLNPAARALIAGGVRWLLDHQNADGGWGDTVKSLSNISTAYLCRATLAACGGSVPDARIARIVRDACDHADGYLAAAGGIPAVVARYGKDRTFSVPILTHLALAGMCDWRTIPALPFELAALPPRFYAAVRLPVVSYALPALIAIGQVRHHFAPTRNPVARFARNAVVARTLRVLESLQPPHGGFLEASPLTGFVTMSLAAMGLAEHPVAVRGAKFLADGVRPDGSWPIDTNLATWVTTLAVNALGDDLPGDARGPIRDWLLGQQYRTVHPYTRAKPGGWAWTDLPGGVPDADDTSGAVLALDAVGQAVPDVNNHPAADAGSRQAQPDLRGAIRNGVRWLLDLRNRDGGVPTFCRGWGTLPFDRSAPDITAHAVRALEAYRYARARAERQGGRKLDGQSVPYPYRPSFQYLREQQRPDGSWLPLWFGNQHAPDDANPTYGTAKVLAAFRDCGLADDPAAVRGVDWLRTNQNDDGGWGGMKGCPSSVEETALAVEILCRLAPDAPEPWRGVDWLIARVEDGTWVEPSPIGFYFAKLWYFERLYPVVFTVAALRAAS